MQPTVVPGRASQPLAGQHSTRRCFWPRGLGPRTPTKSVSVCSRAILVPGRYWHVVALRPLDPQRSQGCRCEFALHRQPYFQPAHPSISFGIQSAWFSGIKIGVPGRGVRGCGVPIRSVCRGGTHRVGIGRVGVLLEPRDCWPNYSWSAS